LRWWCIWCFSPVGNKYISLYVFPPVGLSENHSLTYIYTGLSKPVGLPGIHEFTAMGLLDDKMIDYFDSENQAKIPKQEWMKTCVPENYWKEGTQSRKNKLQWFKESINILMQQMGQNDSVLHVLQWMVGCEVEMQPGGKLKFLQGFWKYNYDGDDFLYLDNKGQEWGAVNYVAELTKRKWDHYWNAKGYTKNYLENTCIDWLSNLLNCGQQQLRNTSAPEVYAIKKEAKVKTNITLICLVTGFYQKDIIMRIKRNEYILTEKDGLISSGVVPNGDETSQRSDHVESDLSMYSCEVIHSAKKIIKFWGKKLLFFAPPSQGNLKFTKVMSVVGSTIKNVWLYSRKRVQQTSFFSLTYFSKCCSTSFNDYISTHKPISTKCCLF
uniref:Ig-like domain-containing protein n=1 Tax=Neolamprologus brichardi TaxID=32507 RepID=A0A3Q4GDI6_NEOBR